MLGLSSPPLILRVFRAGDPILEGEPVTESSNLLLAGVPPAASAAYSPLRRRLRRPGVEGPAVVAPGGAEEDSARMVSFISFNLPFSSTSAASLEIASSSLETRKGLVPLVSNPRASNASLSSATFILLTPDISEPHFLPVSARTTSENKSETLTR